MVNSIRIIELIHFSERPKCSVCMCRAFKWGHHPMYQYFIHLIEFVKHSKIVMISSVNSFGRFVLKIAFTFLDYNNMSL